MTLFYSQRLPDCTPEFSFDFSCVSRFSPLFSSFSHFIFIEIELMCVCTFAQSCPTLCDPVDYSPPDSSLRGISRQRYWSGLPFPQLGRSPTEGSSQLRDQLCVFCIARWMLYYCTPWEALELTVSTFISILLKVVESCSLSSRY